MKKELNGFSTKDQANVNCIYKASSNWCRLPSLASFVATIRFSSSYLIVRHILTQKKLFPYKMSHFCCSTATVKKKKIKPVKDLKYIFYHVLSVQIIKLNLNA